MRFELVAHNVRATETRTCFSSAQDVMAELPMAVVGTDLDKLPVTSLDELKAAFAQIVADTLAQASLRVEPR